MTQPTMTDNFGRFCDLRFINVRMLNFNTCDISYNKEIDTSFTKALQFISLMIFTSEKACEKKLKTKNIKCQENQLSLLPVN